VEDVMAYRVETEWYNGYRCSCCTSRRTDGWFVDTLEEALAELPTEFPVEDEGGLVRVTVTDGATGKRVAESLVSFAPVWQRGDGYKFTGWSLYVDEEAAPGRGTYVHQIIEGVNRRQDLHPMFDEDPPLEPEPLKFITDRDWSALCDELAEARRQRDLREAKAAIAEAEKKIARLTGSPVTG
jgi:hypothetical protein